MRIKDVLIDSLIDTKLFEMARSRAAAKDLITHLSPQIIHHLIKLFVFNSPENKNHWLKEIDGWLNQIDDIYLKPSKKKPDWQTIYNWIIYDSSPHYDANYIDGKIKKWAMYDYKDTETYDYDAEVILNKIFKVILEISKDIATPNKFISIRNYLEYQKEQT